MKRIYSLLLLATVVTPSIFAGTGSFQIREQKRAFAVYTGAEDANDPRTMVTLGNMKAACQIYNNINPNYPMAETDLANFENKFGARADLVCPRASTLTQVPSQALTRLRNNMNTAGTDTGAIATSLKDVANYAQMIGVPADTVSILNEAATNLAQGANDNARNNKTTNGQCSAFLLRSYNNVFKMIEPSITEPQDMIDALQDVNKKGKVTTALNNFLQKDVMTFHKEMMKKLGAPYTSPKKYPTSLADVTADDGIFLQLLDQANTFIADNKENNRVAGGSGKFCEKTIDAIYTNIFQMINKSFANPNDINTTYNDVRRKGQILSEFNNFIAELNVTLDAIIENATGNPQRSARTLADFGPKMKLAKSSAVRQVSQTSQLKQINTSIDQIFTALGKPTIRPQASDLDDATMNLNAAVKEIQKQESSVNVLNTLISQHNDSIDALGNRQTNDMLPFITFMNNNAKSLANACVELINNSKDANGNTQAMGLYKIKAISLSTTSYNDAGSQGVHMLDFIIKTNKQVAQKLTGNLTILVDTIDPYMP